MYRSCFVYCLTTSMLLALSPAVPAAEFECTIKNVLRLSESGNIVRHGWAANYQERKFTVDRESGRVLRTTALKQRLSNYDTDSLPRIIDQGDKSGSYQAVTLFEEEGNYSVLQIDNPDSSNHMPFIYRTGIGMILTGLCGSKG